MATPSIPAEGHWSVDSGRRGLTPARASNDIRAGERGAHTALRSLWAWSQRALLALALVLFLALAVLPRLGLYRPVTVLSGSMRPTFSPGDMVIVTPEPVSAVRVGQVISYQVPVGVHQVETHRVVRILQGGPHPVIQTQGDANNWPDPWTARLQGATAWRLTAVVPHLGYVVNWLRSPVLRMAAIVVVPALLALLMVFEIWGLGGASAEKPSGAKPLVERAGPWEQRLGPERRVRRQPWSGPERRVGRERRAGRRADWTPPIHLPQPAAGQA